MSKRNRSIEQQRNKVTKAEDPQIALIGAELISSNGKICARANHNLNPATGSRKGARR